MAESSRAPMVGVTGGAADRLPRCCARHPDWATLSQHLVEEFAELTVGDVVREVARAKDAVENMRLELLEALAVGELIVRHQLMMLSGRVAEVARLDPERHDRMSRSGRAS